MGNRPSDRVRLFRERIVQKVLVINCGSSSIKFRLFDMDGKTELAAGLIDRIGQPDSHMSIEAAGQTVRHEQEVSDYETGCDLMVGLLTEAGLDVSRESGALVGVGHRVVHGGEAFRGSVVVDDSVMAKIEAVSDLAPLHNPANLAGLRATGRRFQGLPQVAVFDTAFFQTIPKHAYTYALPYEWYERKKIRRYGFHGTSHRYVSLQAADILEKPLDSCNLITLHLGNGCSMACVRDGLAVDTTMGLTPLEGLVMGTRSGDLDPAIIFHMVREGMTVDEVKTSLEKKSGLLGVSGVSSDLRDVMKAAGGGNERAALAIDVFAYRARKYIGAFAAVLGRVDAVVFTGGIGENAPAMRQAIVSGMGGLGMELDEARNGADRGGAWARIGTDDSPTQLLVVPTNEDLMIARDTAELVGGDLCGRR